MSKKPINLEHLKSKNLEIRDLKHQILEIMSVGFWKRLPTKYWKLYQPHSGSRVTTTFWKKLGVFRG